MLLKGFGENVLTKSSHGSDDRRHLVVSQVEECDRFGGFLTLQSVAGGTGSGLGTSCTFRHTHLIHQMVVKLKPSQPTSLLKPVTRSTATLPLRPLRLLAPLLRSLTFCLNPIALASNTESDVFAVLQADAFFRITRRTNRYTRYFPRATAGLRGYRNFKLEPSSGS